MGKDYYIEPTIPVSHYDSFVKYMEDLKPYLNERLISNIINKFTNAQKDAYERGLKEAQR